jgi:hypothetical protein
MNSPESLFDRWISRPRDPRLTAVLGLVLVLALFVAAYLDGVLAQFFRQGSWRGLLTAPLVVLYILVIAPILARMDTDVINAFRSIAEVDDATFDLTIQQADRTRPANEMLVFAIGCILGVITFQSGNTYGQVSWIILYWLVSTVLVYGLLAWIIYMAVAHTIITAAMHRLPLRVDIFEARPFEAIGRQSLAMALAFVGGITLSLVATMPQAQTLRLWQFWVVYAPLAAIPVVIFFLNMRPTHRLLAAARQRELDALRSQILHSCRNLVQRLEAAEDAGNLAAEINALTLYEQRVLAANTWPYNVAMLRTLFFSVLVPGGAALARLLGDILLPW